MRPDDRRGTINKFLHEIELNLHDYFIASFSANSDVLNQWTMYADDGRGVAIGFRTSDFNVPQRVPSLAAGKNTGMFAVEYGARRHKQHAKDLLAGTNKPSDKSGYLIVSPAAAYS